jgi:hypothetical protein
MKPKMQHHVQPRESIPHSNTQASEEIEKFLRAVESYPERVAQEPSLTFRQHLASLFESRDKNTPRN